MPNILCPKNKKNFSENFLLSFAHKKEKKNKACIYKASTSVTKLCSFCLRQSLPMGKKKPENTCLWKKKQRFFVLPFQGEFPKWRKQKTNKRGQKFFFFLSRQHDCCATQGNIFLFHNCPKSTSLWQLRLVEKKSSSFFLLKKLRSYKKNLIRDL